MSTAAGSTGAPEPPGSRSSRLHRLMALSGALSDGRDEREVLRLAASCVARLGPWRTEAGYLPADGRLVRCPLDSRASAAMRRALDSQVDGLGGQDGAVLLADREWSWAFALQGPDGRAGSTATGYLVVSAGRRPGDDDIALLGLLARQTGAAVTGTAARRREREYAAELSRARQDGIAARARLAAVESELTYRRSVHDALSGATATGDTEAGIAWTVHRLTGFSAVVEDQFGNLRAWAAPAAPTRIRSPTRDARSS